MKASLLLVTFFKVCVLNPFFFVFFFCHHTAIHMVSVCIIHLFSQFACVCLYIFSLTDLCWCFSKLHSCRSLLLLWCLGRTSWMKTHTNLRCHCWKILASNFIVCQLLPFYFSLNELLVETACFLLKVKKRIFLVSIFLPVSLLPPSSKWSDTHC